MTEEEVVDLVETSMAGDDSGLASDVTYVAGKAIEDSSEYASDCNYSGDSTFSSTFSGATRSYDYAYNYTWDVTCDGFIPVALNFNSSRTGNYTGTRLTTDGSALSTLTLTDLFTGSEYTLNGSYDYAGSSELTRQGNTISASYDLDITLTDVKVDKLALVINSGTASFNLIASNDANTLTFTGSVTYLGNGSATVVINGDAYNINI